MVKTHIDAKSRETYIELLRLWQNMTPSFTFPLAGKSTDEASVIISSYDYDFESFWKSAGDANLLRASKNEITDGSDVATDKVGGHYYDFQATIFLLEDGVPVQYKPILIPENMVINTNGSITDDAVLKEKLVGHLQAKISSGELVPESELLPALTQADIIAIKEKYKNEDGLSLASGFSAVIPHQKNKLGNKNISDLSFRLSFIPDGEESDTLKARKEYYPDSYKGLLEGGNGCNLHQVILGAENYYNSEIHDYVEREQERILSGIQFLDVVRERDVILKYVGILKTFQGATREGFRFYITSPFKHGLRTRYQFAKQYPLLVNVFANDLELQGRIDDGNLTETDIIDYLNDNAPDGVLVDEERFRFLNKFFDLDKFFNFYVRVTGDTYIYLVSSIPEKAMIISPEGRNWAFRSRKHFIPTSENLRKWNWLEETLYQIEALSKILHVPYTTLMENLDRDWYKTTQSLAMMQKRIKNV